MTPQTQTKRPRGPADDPWFYGWRYVNRPGPDGTMRSVQVPLTEQDVLFPQEDDFIMQASAHNRDCRFVSTVFEQELQDDPGAVVLADCRVDWNVPGLEPLGPDVAVLFDCRRKYHNWSTFHVGQEGARPSLVVEVTSPSTRQNDLGLKRDYYFQAGIPYYVIADAEQPEDEDEGRRLRLIGLRRGPAGWEVMEANERGWLWLEPINLWLGIVPADEQVPYDRLACYDVDGNEVGDYGQVVAELVAEVRARQEAEARAATAVAERAAEAQARQTAEARAASAVAERAAEAQARQTAEAQARQATEAQRELEQRLRELEEENQRLRGARSGESGPQ